MTASERRQELIGRLLCRRRDTVPNLAFEFGVSENTIRRDILELTRSYPIETRSGHDGGVFIQEGYHPHRNLFTAEQTEVLSQLFDTADERQQAVLAGLLREFGRYTPGA